VTVVTPTIKLIATKAPKLFVMHNPNDIVAVTAISARINGLRFTMSPSGQRNSNPAA
jgi:hypothetical protein